jgi:hypothetical protein
MSTNEQPKKLPIKLNLLDDNKKIIDLNKEHPTILKQIKQKIKEPQYNSIVTMENYKVMKESATELNKTATFIDNFRKAKVKLETKDIENFKSNCKIYCDLIQQKREYILKGLDVFEEETRKEVIKVCTEYANRLIKENNLREEFATAITTTDMTATKYMTATGAISKAGKDEIEKRINEKLTLQTKVDNRLLNLENECLKAGVAPMSQEYIQGFLYSDDAVYQEKLNSLIQLEIKRAEKARSEQETKEKAEKEALKDELHARYESQIKNADMPTLTRINLELKSYDVAATYELKQLSTKREFEISKEKEEVQKPDEKSQDNYLKEIKNEVASDGKIEKTLSIKIRVPGNATDKQVIDTVIKMIKADKFPTENIEVV